MTKEALKLALEALEADELDMVDDGSGNMIFRKEQAITAIKEALAQPEPDWTPERIAGMARLKEAQDKKLAQPEQEPWSNVGIGVDVTKEGVSVVGIYKLSNDSSHLFYSQFYTTPPPVAPPHKRKPLTDEEIYDMYNEPRSDAEMIAFARAIEAAHGIKEKNNG